MNYVETKSMRYRENIVRLYTKISNTFTTIQDVLRERKPYYEIMDNFFCFCFPFCVKSEDNKTKSKKLCKGMLMTTIGTTLYGRMLSFGKQ